MKNARQKADTELVRRQNRSLVLETLRKHSALASIELGEKTGLSPATISAITNDMLNERLIEEDRDETEKHRQVQRGRPKIKLRLAANAAVVLGLQLAHNTIHLLISDFCGTVYDRQDVHADMAHLSAGDVGILLTETVLTFLKDSDIEATHISLISVACQGSVDAEKGEIIWSPAFAANNVPIAEPLTSGVGARCIVANDTNAIAHCIHVEDDDLKTSFAVLYLSSGIGLGLFVNGALLEGSNGSASEFGHMLWREDGALCRCGRNGCIEAYASDFGIFRSAKSDLTDKAPADIEPSEDDMAALTSEARSGVTSALEAFETAGTAIGVGLSNLIMLLNPQQILFTGPGIHHFDLLKPAMDKALKHLSGRDISTKMQVLKDDRNLVEAGLLSMAFTCLDRDIFAKRVSVEDMVARQKLGA